MNKTNIDQALAALADALKSQDPDIFAANPMAFVEKIPKRSLTGDHILGGKVLKFASAGITDQASKEQILIKDDVVTINNLKITDIDNDLSVNGTLTASTVKVDTLEVKNLKAEIKFEKSEPIIFGGDDHHGKGLIWTGVGYAKQFVFNTGPDRFFSSEDIDLAKGKSILIDGVKLFDETSLGSTITKSSIREVGRLKGLVVDGSVNINNFLHYIGSIDRLGLGTDQPNAALSIAEDGIEIIIGTKDNTRGVIGTFVSQPFDILTDNTARISISAGGNIQLGNVKQPPVQVSVHGKLSVKVNSPDPDVDLHVNGAIKYNGKLQKYDIAAPTAGSYNQGDIVWNSEPKMNSYVGWICIKAGSPGVWAHFGRIGS